MEFKLRRSAKRQSSSGTGSSKSSSKLARPLGSTKNNDVERLRRKNHDHNLSQKFLKSSDPRIQPAALTSGHRKYAHIFPPRGTLDDDKLDYLTWRMHLLFAEQIRIDDESRLLLQQDNVVQTTTEQATTIINRPVSSSVYSASLQSDACSSSDAGAVAMDRAVAMEPGWIDNKAADAMNGMLQEAKVALKHALINDNALAAIPLLEREDRLFAIDTATNKVHDRHRKCQEARHSSNATDDSSIEEVVEQTDDTLPPPLMPASMFYRASFGLRTKPSRTTSSQSVPKSVHKHSLPSSPSVSKLRSIFRLQPRRSHSEGPATLYTLGSAP